MICLLFFEHVQGDLTVQTEAPLWWETHKAWELELCGASDAKSTAPQLMHNDENNSAIVVGLCCCRWYFDARSLLAKRMGMGGSHQVPRPALCIFKSVLTR